MRQGHAIDHQRRLQLMFDDLVRQAEPDRLSRERRRGQSRLRWQLGMVRRMNWRHHQRRARIGSLTASRVSPFLASLAMVLGDTPFVKLLVIGPDADDPGR